MIIKTNKLFTDKDTGVLMSLSKYKRLIREEMQKMNITLFYTAYSLKHVAIQKLVRSKKELFKINKVARYALNSTIKIPQQLVIKNNGYFNRKKYKTSERKN
jgi:hypothetical protein